MKKALEISSDQQNLFLRILAAAVMIPAGSWAVLAGGDVLLLATAICSIIAAFEWSWMVLPKDQSKTEKGVFASVLASFAVACVLSGEHGYISLVLITIGGAFLCMFLGATVFPKGKVTMSLGAFYIGLPFGSFIYIREGLTDGASYLMALMVIVWITDIAAFLAGRGFGGPALSPENSPNKTWTGAIGAFICSLLAGASVSRILNGDLIEWVVAAGLISIIGQCGDLLESHFKRRFKVKDTSTVIPGHGGVLDRLDALMAASVFGAMIAFLAPELVPTIKG